MSPYLLISGDFKPTGGMDRANLALADYLARQGEQVHLVAYHATHQLLQYPNVHFHKVLKLGHSYSLGTPLLRLQAQNWAEKITQMGGRVLVNGGNFCWGDINWVHYVHAAYQPRSRSGLLKQIKGAVDRRLSLIDERKALKIARIVIANSERTKQDLVQFVQIPEELIHTVYLGLDSQIFCPAELDEQRQLRLKLGWKEEKPIAVFIGALGDRRKGFDTVFSAWQHVCRYAGWDVDLVVVGQGAELDMWRKRSQNGDMNHRINFLGFRTDIPDILRAADCLIAPTRYEAYGLGIHEALCCGLPAIVSINAGVAERYPSDCNGLLLRDPEDVEELIERLYSWRSSLGSYRQLINRFASKLRSYTWDNMAKLMLEKIQA